MKAVVVGSGLAALIAARELAVNSGVNIEIFTDGEGASPFVHGFNIPLHPEDSVPAFIADTLDSGRGINNKELVRVLCNSRDEILQLLARCRVELDRTGDAYSLMQPLGSSCPRVVTSGPDTGVRIMKAIRSELSASANVYIRRHHRVLRLVRTRDAVCGVVVYAEKEKKLQTVQADCVVLASGGFGGLFPFSTNPADLCGDGIAMAYYAGVPLMDLEFIQYEPSAAVFPPALTGRGVITTMLYDGAVLRNGSGERFMQRYGAAAEQVNKDVLSLRIQQEIDAGRGTMHGGVYMDCTAVLHALLTDKYAAYRNRYLPHGIDLTKEMIEIAPAPHTTLGGVMIDAGAVTPLPGLFAAGEITGGLHGANRIGGNAGLETLVFGLRAGQSAAAWLKQCCSRPLPLTDIPRSVQFDPKRFKQIRVELSDLLASHLSVIRNREGLVLAADKISCLLKEVHASSRQDDQGFRDPQLICEALRLDNDLRCAQLAFLSAAERSASLGCHNRADSQQENSHYNVCVRQSESEPLIYRAYY